MTLQEIQETLMSLPEAHWDEDGGFLVRDSLYPELRWACFVGIKVSESTIDIYLPGIKWVGQHEPKRIFDLWRSTMLSKINSALELRELVEVAIKARRDQFVTCRICKRIVLLEYMDEDNVCMGCAPAEFGIVY